MIPASVLQEQVERAALLAEAAWAAREQEEDDALDRHSFSQYRKEEVHIMHNSCEDQGPLAGAARSRADFDPSKYGPEYVRLRKGTWVKRSGLFEDDQGWEHVEVWRTSIHNCSTL